ncbi:maleylpyruvate isomerase N-terminal domain-containing protein [Kitasatospora sp. NPDC002227]|uniref:maleylpyruvate isomerase N-terminal domain-containing protein n=1 Tax=Kitasatospora sp. NPDC002227 TaxID=3154773 RepID=UPI003322D200
MSGIRGEFLAAARVAVELLRAPEVAAAWERPSVLAQFRVSGLAGHLANQVLVLPGLLAAPVPQCETVPVVEHYARASWVDAPVDSEVNVMIREGGEELAAGGPQALAEETAAVLAELADLLPGAPERPVQGPGWGWALTLDELLLTRLMELTVHGDDLAVSVGLPTPEFPAGAVEASIGLLSRLAVRRHGPAAVLRAFTRAERAPERITVF